MNPMNKNREEQAMGFGTTHMNLNKWANEKSGKTHRSISNESIQKRTSLNRNSMKMRYMPNAMTGYPKKQIIELSKLMKGDLRINPPTNGSTSNERHDVIKVKRLCVRVHKLLYQRYTKSRCHYLKSNDILFTPYPTLHKLNVGWSGVDKEVRVELSNQNNQRGIRIVQKR